MSKFKVWPVFKVIRDKIRARGSGVCKTVFGWRLKNPCEKVSFSLVLFLLKKQKNERTFQLKNKGFDVLHSFCHEAHFLVEPRLL